MAKSAFDEAFEQEPKVSEFDKAFESTGGSGREFSREEAKLLSEKRLAEKYSQYPEMGKAGYEADIQNLKESIPLGTSLQALKQGYKTGQEAFGEGIIGKTAGAIGGTAMGLGTIFNPLAKAANYIPRLAQAGGEALIGDFENAKKSAEGTRDYLPDIEPYTANLGLGETVNTIANLPGELFLAKGQGIHDPINTAAIAKGITEPAFVEGVKGLPKSAIESAKSLKEVGKGAFPRGVSKRTAETALANVWDTDTQKGRSFYDNSTENGNAEIIVREIKKTGETPKTGEQFEKAHKDTLKRLGEQIEDFDQKHGDKYTIESPSSEQVVNELRQETLLSPEQQEQIKTILDEQGVGGKVSFSKALETQKKINSKYQAKLKALQYNLDAANQDPLFQAYDKARRAYSAQIGDVIKGVTGEEDNFYRNYGLVSESADLATARLQKLRPKVARETEEGFLKQFKNIDLTKPSTLIEPFSKLRGGKLLEYDDSVQRLFGKSKTSNPKTLSAAERDKALQGKEIPENTEVLPTPEEARSMEVARSMKPRGSSAIPENLIPLEQIIGSGAREIPRARMNPKKLSSEAEALRQQLILEEALKRKAAEKAASLSYF